ncbi:hypothetical protein FNI11_11775 [Salmonella enterica subsp. salamae]|nr:hypothetical protein [Salmonella enterica subsp. salamae]ECJ2280726.1 hypothetical protein [Salmonella enterica subsp. salamae]HCC0886623.1 hypothetical protein [Salmonella enterica]
MSISAPARRTKRPKRCWTGSKNDLESIATIQAGLDAGINFIDVADFCSMGRDEYYISNSKNI